MTERIRCATCKTITNHEVRAQDKESYRRENIPEMEIEWADGLWQILKCAGCDSRSFREVWDSEMDPEPYETIYPPRSEKQRSPKQIYAAPLPVQILYEQTVSAFNHQMAFLCAAGLRSIIEGVCADKGINDGPITDLVNGSTTRKSTLQGKIEGLAEKHLLSRDEADALHEHRHLGNEALHDLKPADFGTLEIAIDMVEHMLELYEVSRKAAILKSRRSGGPP